jgi:outer membrane lipoprotein-sorting protein
MRRSILALALLLLPLSAVQAQDAAAAQKLYEAMEQKLAKAKACRFDFEIDGLFTKLKGTLLLSSGNRLKLTFAGLDGNDKVRNTIVSDGEKLATQYDLDGHSETVTTAADEKLVDRTIGWLTKSGAFVAASNIVDSEHRNAAIMKLSGFKMAGKEKVGGREANVVEYQFLVGKEMLPSTCKLWLDAQTNLPVKRIVEISKFRVVETYSNWELDPKLPDDTFTLPK